MKDSNENIKIIPKSKLKTIIIKLEDLEKLSAEGQEQYFEDIFDKIYSGEKIESLRKYSLRCIKLTCDPKNNKIHLPYGVVVEKDNNEIIIKSQKKKNWFIFVILFTLLLLGIIGASYSYINNSITIDLNKDIDKDGIADINLDLNNDRIAEVNVDTNNDNIPDYNIDYKGNRKPIFNIDTNHNGKADFNLINVDTNNDGICDLNCDNNNDGWPDINLDVDGDGVADIEIDVDNDGRPELNFDLDRDMKCDLHCDTTKDGNCDKYCLVSDEVGNVTPVKSGTSSTITSKDISYNSDTLEIEFEDENIVYITGIYPDDQPNYTQNIPVKRFKVINRSGLYLTYNLKWIVSLNDYTTDHFQYSVTSTLNGANLDFTPVPKETSALKTGIVIPPYSTQDYEVNFKLVGTGQAQNEDQGRTFAAHIEIQLDN